MYERHKGERTTPIETKAQCVAANLASKQAMRVSWKRFCETHKEYRRWEAFVLWTRAIVEGQGGAPASLVRVLKGMRVSERKKSEHLLRCNIRAPWHPVRLRFRGVPFWPE